MKVIRNNKHSVLGYLTKFSAYGKLRGNYMLQVVTPLDLPTITLYKGAKKPIFKDVYVTGILGVLYTIVLIPMMILATIWIMLTAFYHTCLFKESFITTWYDQASGYISLALSLTGLGFLISLLF